MIKAVVQSIPTYFMSVFKLPMDLCKDIEAMIQKFWWGNGATRKVHCVKWNSLCSSKSIGGIGGNEIQYLPLLLLYFLLILLPFFYCPFNYRKSQ